MNTNILRFLSSLEAYNVPREDIRWKISHDDVDFFTECLSILKKYNIRSVLDISCGIGNFVKICNINNIEAYGIDPIDNTYENIYRGTYASIINCQHELHTYKFDCICVHNTLHGKYHKVEELTELFLFFKMYAKYIIISDPIIDDSLVSQLQLEHVFNGSHGNKSAIHKLYKI